MTISVLDSHRRNGMKRAFSTRRVPPGAMSTIIAGDVRPNAGDLVLARVDVLGKQTKLELTDGRRAHLFPGDEILVSYGNRYAPDQFEAVVSDDLSPCALVAAGGVAGVELARHLRVQPATQITPIGLVGDTSGKRINLAQFRIEASEQVPDLPVVLSLGTSMNAGKTLTSTSLVRGFKRAGLQVAALKITGTGAGGDMWIVRDAGADVALDFTDAGFASTYLAPIDDILAGAFRLINHAASLGCEVVVIEIADGLQQKETAQLIRSDVLRGLTMGCTFASYDAMGAICGVRELAEAGHTVLGISGRLGLSPLGVREAESATGLRYYSPFDLQDGLLVPAIQRRAARAFSESRFQKYSLHALAKAAMPAQPAYPVPPRGLAAPGASGGLEIASPGASGASEEAREMLAIVAGHLMDHEVVLCCGMGPGAHLTGRTNRRNGFRRLVWASGMGAIELRVPRLRHGTYIPSFLGTAVAPGDVEAVLRAPDACAREVALLGLLRTLGGPGLGRADAMRVAARISHLVADAVPAAPLAAMPPRVAWPGGDEAEAREFGALDGSALDGDDEDAAELPGGVAEMSPGGAGARALSPPR